MCTVYFLISFSHFTTMGIYKHINEKLIYFGQCAHGRPALAPLLELVETEDDVGDYVRSSINVEKLCKF